MAREREMSGTPPCFTLIMSEEQFFVRKFPHTLTWHNKGQASTRYQRINVGPCPLALAGVLNHWNKI